MLFADVYKFVSSSQQKWKKTFSQLGNYPQQMLLVLSTQGEPHLELVSPSHCWVTTSVLKADLQGHVKCKHLRVDPAVCAHSFSVFL